MSERIALPDAHVRVLDGSPAVLRRLAAMRPRDYPVLLESVADGPLGRASVLAAKPRAALWLDAEGRIGATGAVPRGESFLSSLERWWLAERVTDEADARPEVPFAGGWVLYLGYEVAQEVEPRLTLPRGPLPWRAFALRTPCALVHLHATDQLLAVAEPEAASVLDALASDVDWASGPDAAARDAAASAPLTLRIVEEDPARFLERVQRAQAYIGAGDIYQANLSRDWRVLPEPAHRAGRHGLSVGELYARLSAANPAPFAALAQWGDMAILSSSPERLIRLQSRDVETRPIAGTRPRSRRPGGDAVEAAALIAHPKERAEHIMLIDLERNDLGRVCEAGSVHVDELMVTETYAHVHHIVSSVRGRLRAGVTPIGALRAVFPGGTITGCPKFRCMQIIAELEGEGRGAYTGSLGFLTRSGAMDLNILIRTLTVLDGQVGFRAGAGIVADSVPERELEETRAKARGLLAAFDGSASGASP
ncbi:MAG TPA: aminodeoxychorismate synthase component I [Steroidobacteraceae bacterium]|nr:aminodeoxychorismate synthase component I [Steroidobacteraceae bacterium]